MIKRGKITEEKLAHIYSTIQKIIKNQQCYYTNEEIEDLKRELEEANATGFTDKLMTMININTMSNDTAANGGRPAKDDASLTDSGAKTRSNASNIEKGGKI